MKLYAISDRETKGGVDLDKLLDMSNQAFLVDISHRFSSRPKKKIMSQIKLKMAFYIIFYHFGKQHG